MPVIAILPNGYTSQASITERYLARFGFHLPSVSPPPSPRLERAHRFSCGHKYKVHGDTLYPMRYEWNRDVPCPACLEKMSLDYVLERKWERSMRYKVKAWFRRKCGRKARETHAEDWQRFN